MRWACQTMSWRWHRETMGEAVARASVSEWCLSPAVVQPPLPGEARHQAQMLRGPGWWVWRGVQKWVLWSCVGFDGSGTTSSSCFWSLFQCWKTAPSLGSARLSKLYCKRGQVLWKSIHSARVFTGAFILDNCSETWMNHVTSAKHGIMHLPNLSATKFIGKK